jgi:hypothetical protein
MKYCIIVFALLHSNFCVYLTRSRIYTMRNSVTNKLHIFFFVTYCIMEQIEVRVSSRISVAV